MHRPAIDLPSTLYALVLETSRSASKRNEPRIRELKLLVKNFQAVENRKAQAEALRIKEQEIALRQAEIALRTAELPIRAQEAELMMEQLKHRKRRGQERKPKPVEPEPADPLALARTAEQAEVARQVAAFKAGRCEAGRNQ
jgi:predicted metal-dependent hydrolase